MCYEVREEVVEEEEEGEKKSEKRESTRRRRRSKGKSEVWAPTPPLCNQRELEHPVNHHHHHQEKEQFLSASSLHQIT